MGEATLAATVALAVSAVLVMGLRRPARRLGLVDRPGGRKRHDGAVPIVGGIAVFAAFMVGSGLAVWPGAPFLTGACLIVAVGIVDDLYGMPSWLKLAFQGMAAAMVVVWGGLEATQLGSYPAIGTLYLGAWALPLSLIAVVGLINGVNMLDGVDGLAGGVSLAALAWLAVIASITDAAVTPALMAPMLGALAGFLIFNMRNPWRRKASVFLGDAGSMFLGFATAWFALALIASQDRVSPVGIAWVVALPVIDTLSLMTRRLMKGNNPFAPDREHLHHIFQRAHYSPKETSALLTLLAALMGVVGVGGSLVGVPDVLLLFGLIALAVAHFVFIKAAWRTMRALRRVRGQPSALLGCPPKRSENTPDLPCWRRRTGLAGLYICVAAAPFGAVGALGGFALTIVATLLVWPRFWRDVRAMPVAWVAFALGSYLAVRGSFPSIDTVTAAGLHWADLFRISGLLSLPLAWWLACHRQHWRGLLAVLLVAGSVNLAVEVDWQAVNAGAVSAPFARGDTSTSGIINVSVLLFLIAGMVAAVRRLGRGWRPACQFAVCLVLSVPLVFLLVSSGYATAWLGLLAGMAVLAFLAVWYGITRSQWAGLAASIGLIAALGGGFYAALQEADSGAGQVATPLQAGMLVLEGRADDAAARHAPTVDRLRRWAEGLGVMADRPWLGTGAPALPDVRGVSDVPGRLGNLYLAIGLGFGLLGLALFSLLALMLARECICAVRDRVWSGEIGMAVLGAAASFAVMFVFVAPIQELVSRGSVVMLLALMMAAAFERRWAAQAVRNRIARLAPLAAPSRRDQAA